MTITKEQARIYRAAILKAAQSLSDEDALTAPMLFERWDGNGISYSAGTRLYHDGVLYKVLQDHTSQDSWNPLDAPSLFAKVLIPDPQVIPDWEQPESTNPYMKDDKVKHNGKTWISIIDNNVWEPGVYGWEEVTE